MHFPFTDNTAWFGDPDVVESPVRGLSSHEFGAFRAACSPLERALSRPVAAADPRRFDRGAPLGATALSRHEPEAAADAEGAASPGVEDAAAVETVRKARDLSIARTL